MTDADLRRAERRMDAAQKKVTKARQALVNAQERRDYALSELRDQQRRSWLRRQAKNLP